MNKQELIETLEEIRGNIDRDIEIGDRTVFSRGEKNAYNNAIGLVKQLDEPEKVVVPKFVAKKIESYGSALEMLANEYFDQSSEEVDSDELACWIDGNADLFFNAWVCGYEVEKEQLYYVKLPGVGYLNNADGGIKHTDKEIKAIDERYWPFAVKVDGE
ncbi:DUF1642 domain-containing protein [Enterococcus faecalis]|uniref:DUF1642 domain-containing protein n=1 Tax=Enterococcus faecalis TaxID=1351 RepID=UPI0001E1A46D|nr:DUF1642 domain-containing protein [Enterococcus faecalis]EFM69434.1 hypothetical protein HMPREF9505_02321 [Enterococcus faecalis TX0109]EGO2604400.1 DUF1642 domain-containing protein [Enterococcus faecalis]EGO6564389.1 DUF1642 domain-containing protein [Enterococcus faecalis]EGO8879621.1 DUF1642 domain-containing protein [Enterococcus faecalis]EGO8973903.1 DUF1642 domain-containing protein [Enterococcus faecalis]